MRDQQASARVIASADLREYFHVSVGDALSKQGVDATVETVYYLVNLLSLFQRSERFFDVSDNRREIRPLAMLYADALEGRSVEERNHIMQRMGDVALFVSGVLSESLSRKLVDVDVWTENGQGQKTTPGKAVVVLNG